MTQASWPATTYAELAEIIRRNETAGDAARRFARGVG